MSRRLRSLALCALLAAGCAAAVRVTPQTVTYAPSLNVDLGAMRRLPSGVYLRDLAPGDGAAAARGDRVAVHFVGWLPDGTQFDAAAPPGPPVEFRLGSGEVIRGWDVGIEGMRPGGQRMLVIPPGLGYGDGTAAGVPAGSVLVFVVERPARR